MSLVFLLQYYDLYKTEELPNLAGSSFSPKVTFSEREKGGGRGGGWRRGEEEGCARRNMGDAC